MPGPSDSSRIQAFHAAIPEFIWPMLDQLYGSLYSSRPQLQPEDLEHASTYVRWYGSRPAAIFLFRIRGALLGVINQGMTIPPQELSQFMEWALAEFPQVCRIDFHAVSLQSGDMPVALPGVFLAFGCSEDSVIPLPQTEAAYLTQLGKSSRKALKRGLSGSESVAHQIIDGPDVAAEMVEQVIRFNRARMQLQERQSAHNHESSARLHELLRARGSLGLISVRGRPCAGTLVCRVGDDIYSLVTAHDPAHDKLGAGNLSRYLMIAAAIQAGVKRFHLMGGNFPHKRGWLAQRVCLHHWVLYRRAWHGVPDLFYLAKLGLGSFRLQLQHWREDASFSPTQSRRQRLAQTIELATRNLRHYRSLFRRWV